VHRTPFEDLCPKWVSGVFLMEGEELRPRSTGEEEKEEELRS
jgi:hypothetical protein